jgi:thioredoxin-dependent peroxiredoxin
MGAGVINMAIALVKGRSAPDFTLQDSQEKKVSLREMRGKKVVLYFYPKDNTPGCTIEAMAFSKYQNEFKKLGAVILGVSKDSCASHQKFTKDKKLTINLLSDPDHQVMLKYGVWRPKKFMGKEFLGTVRSTFLIDEKGKIVQVWDEVQAKGHAEAVLRAVEDMA